MQNQEQAQTHQKQNQKQRGIPIMATAGLTIADAWESSLMAVYNSGIEIPTQYDKKGDRLSKDCSMLIIVDNPLQEPMLHRALPGSLKSLGDYIKEVLYGRNDSHIRDDRKPGENGIYYTYHSRLFDYGVAGIDQIDYIVDNLSNTPYSRRAQGITWYPDLDVYQDDPPCLQSIWCRITEEEGELYLSMNVRFRSRDAYRAAFMNMFALVQMQHLIATRIAHRISRPVNLGRYADFSDSYHIYGSCLQEFEERFLKSMSREVSQRRWNYLDMQKHIHPESV